MASQKVRVHFTLIAALGLLLASGVPAQAQVPADYDLPVAGGAHFFTQTDGASGASGFGYAVSNADGIPFWGAFQSFGGVPAVGYPVSHRFWWKGFVVQAFQRVVFQWNPQENAVRFVNVLDEIHNAGLDPYVHVVRQVPMQADWSSDAGLTFPQIVSRHLAVLDANPAIAAAYYAELDALTYNGLPMAPIQNMGNVLVLRAQRKIFQQWLIDVPWARAGQVVIANGGDLGKEVGLYPQGAVIPRPPWDIPLSTVADAGSGTVPYGIPTATPVPTNTPVPTSTPQTSVCNGDEEMRFVPDRPRYGERFEIEVTSARPSANVGLSGPWDPDFIGARSGWKGTIWTWHADAWNTGWHEFRFTVSGVVCTARSVEVIDIPSATSTPVSYGCAGDEEMTFDPQDPDIGQPVEIRVTSNRPSVNVSLSGPWNPSFLGAREGGRGTIWTWRVVPLEPGRFTYNFVIGGAVCRTATFSVGISR